MKIFILNVGGKQTIANSASNQKYFDTTLVSITSASSLVSSGIDYSVIGSCISNINVFICVMHTGKKMPE